jgi:ketosteroid isomerase-like protein
MGQTIPVNAAAGLVAAFGRKSASHLRDVTPHLVLACFLGDHMPHPAPPAESLLADLVAWVVVRRYRGASPVQQLTGSAMSDHDAVLAANLEFYRAFATRDAAAMDALWAKRAAVGCLHPGWTALTDREAIVSSWSGILSNPDAPRISCFDERVMLYGDTALVLCEEELDGGTLAATNLFVREDGGWRIAHHHAGQIVRRQAERRRPSRLN